MDFRLFWGAPPSLLAFLLGLPAHLLGLFFLAGLLLLLDGELLLMLLLLLSQCCLQLQMGVQGYACNHLRHNEGVVLP